MPFIYGHNIAGYLPESDPGLCATFDDAKAALIFDLGFAEEHAEDETGAENYSAAAQDVNLWSETDTDTSVYVTPNGGAHTLPEAWWIEEVSDEDAEAYDPDGTL